MASFSGQNDLLELNEPGFDFSVQFEQLFFSIIPSVLFIAFSLWRSLSQARKPTVIEAPMFQLIKLTAIATYIGLELSLVVLVALGTFYATGVFIASSVLKLVSALLMAILSLIDHRKSLRPSVLLNSYLFLTLLFDAVQARTLFLTWTVKPELTYSSIFTATIALKLGILLLEAQRKTRWVIWNEKERSPEETSGIFSLGVFFWLNKIFLKGYQKILKLEDLFPLDTSLHGKTLHKEFSKHMDYSKLKSDKFALAKVLIRTLRVPLLLPVLPRLALLGFTFCQPLFIERLLLHLSESKVGDNIGYGLIGASVLIYSGIAISWALCWYFHNRLRSMTRSILVIETYIKATQSTIGSSDDNAGLTLMSTDIERIHLGLIPLHDIWAAVIQVALSGYMLHSQLGVVFVAPMAVVAFCVAGLMLVMNFAGDSQRAWMNGVQKRVGLTATVIGSMKNIKMSGLADPVTAFVQKLRVDELAAGAKFRKIYIIAALLGFIPLLLSPPLTLAFAQRDLNATRMFTSLAYLLLLTSPLSDIFQMVPQLMSAMACLGRIQAFIKCETRSDYREFLTDAALADETPVDSTVSSRSSRDSQDAIVITNGSFGWNEDNFALQNVNVQIPKASLTIIVGAIGSGKSTLSKALLGEIPYKKGSVSLNARSPHVGFCDQTPFLSNGTIRDNIISFSPFDPKRYSEVVKATVLGYDFATLERGDQTYIGSDGITLSGGQKQRVSLARALYLQTDLLIMDDVFSGLDADTEEHVFRRVFGADGLLRQRGTTAVLCTHSVRHLPAADHIIALGGGTIAEQGHFSELVAGSGYVHSIGLRSPSDGDITPERSSHRHTPQEIEFEVAAVPAQIASSVTPGEDDSRQNGDRTVYRHYSKSVGPIFVILSLFFAALWGFFTNFPTIWLKFWTDDVYSSNPNHYYAYYAGIYALLNLCGLISLLLLGICIFIIFVKRAGASLHHDALRTLVQAPLRFFTTTDTGVVTNLFSQDLNLVDTELPSALLSTLFSVAQALGQAAVMITSSPFIAISYPFLVALLWVVQKFYLRTSRQLRLLDLETKSPLYTHFLDTRKGIATLRAFGFISKDVAKNAELVDSSQRPAYLLVMIQQWLNLVLNLIVMVIAVVLTTLAVRLHSNTAFTGAALVTLMNFGESLSGIISWWTKLETSIGAVARLKAFEEKVKPENKKGEDIVPAERWPQNGALVIKNISASYDPSNVDSANIALRNINLEIRPGEKIAICGRTGSGKSSLVALLLKLLEPLPSNGGEVIIDDIPLYRIDRPALRQRILAVPQEAVFLPEGTTFKLNLDPFDVSTYKECQAVLMTVGLWDFVQGLGGLDSGMNADSLSAGQRQLLSLGRVLLRRRVRARNTNLVVNGMDGGILLLDEVSSSVDHETERAMQEILSTEFSNYTVIAVSHRLGMIMDFDRVVVMDSGIIVELGVPRELAQSPGSRFGDLVRAGGK